MENKKFAYFFVSALLIMILASFYLEWRHGRDNVTVKVVKQDAPPKFEYEQLDWSKLNSDLYFTEMEFWMWECTKKKLSPFMQQYCANELEGFRKDHLRKYPNMERGPE